MSEHPRTHADTTVPSMQAHLEGGGAIAQDGSQAAGAGGVVIGGDNQGTVITGTQINTIMLTLSGGRTETRLFAGVPPKPKTFVGRDALVASLCDRLKQGGVVALQGIPGVGKTTLATALAWNAELLAHFSGGVLWAALGPTPSLDDLLARWADALGLDITQEPDSDRRAALIQARLGGRPFLFVLDDVWQEAPAEVLCRITAPGCAHLLTTRDQRIAAHVAPGHFEPVHELSEDEAVALLEALCPVAARADGGALQRLARAVGGLPLALTLIGGYLGDHSAFAAEAWEAFQVLQDAEAWLGLADRERRLSLREVIDLSVAALPDESTRQVFARLAGFAPKPADFALAAAQAVGEGTLGELGTLVRRNLLEAVGGERVTLHPVIAACAEQHANEDGTLTELQTRHARHYLDEASQNPLAWQAIEAEWSQIQRGWGWAVANRDEWTLEYTWSLQNFLNLRGFWREMLDWYDHALIAAQRLEQRGDEAALLTSIGFFYNRLGEQQRALECYQQALPMLREVGDRAGEADTLNNIGMVYDHLGEWQQALEFIQRALEIRREVGDRVGEANALNNIGLIYDHMGERRRVLEFYQQALVICHEVGERAGEATTLNNIGGLCAELGEWQRALEFFQQALPIRLEVGDRAGESVTLFNMAWIHEQNGDLEQAVRLLEEVVAIREAIFHPNLESNRAKLNALRNKLRSGWLKRLFRSVGIGR